MLYSFQDFLAKSPRYKNKCNIPEMEKIYSEILMYENNLINMIDAIEHGITPVAIIAKEVEQFLLGIPQSTVTLDNSHNRKVADYYRQAIGAMVAVVVEPFGYKKIKGKNLPIPSFYKGSYLSSGATYSKTGTASFQVVRRIVPVEK